MPGGVGGIITGIAALSGNPLVGLVIGLIQTIATKAPGLLGDVKRMIQAKTVGEIQTEFLRIADEAERHRKISEQEAQG